MIYQCHLPVTESYGSKTRNFGYKNESYGFKNKAYGYNMYAMKIKKQKVREHKNPNLSFIYVMIYVYLSFFLKPIKIQYI